MNLEPLSEVLRSTGDRLSCYLVIGAVVFSFAHFCGCTMIALALRERESAKPKP